MQPPIRFDNWRLQTVIEIPRGSFLSGGKDRWYKAITDAAAKVAAPMGCYLWTDAQQVFYCGSFRRYSSPQFRSSLEGRLHNYLQNHAVKERGINTNLRVFTFINAALQDSNVSLKLVAFDAVTLDGQTHSFETYSTTETLVHRVEALLIEQYRKLGQCGWNRTLATGPALRAPQPAPLPPVEPRRQDTPQRTTPAAPGHWTTRSNGTTAEQIMRAVARLTLRDGVVEFTRAEVLRETSIPPAARQKSFDPTFQSMRVDQPGGAPPVAERYRNVFRRVERGRYRLTDYGQQLAREMLN